MSQCCLKYKRVPQLLPTNPLTIIKLIIFFRAKLILDVSGRYLNFRDDLDYNCGGNIICNVTYNKNLSEKVI